MTGKRRFVGRAPGRLDLMGGNGNYSGGLVFEATTAEGTWATVELREDRQVLFFNPQVREIGWEDEVEQHDADGERCGCNMVNFCIYHFSLPRFINSVGAVKRNATLRRSHSQNNENR